MCCLLYIRKGFSPNLDNKGEACYNKQNAVYDSVVFLNEGDKLSEISRLVFQCPTCSSSEGVKEGTQIKCAFCGNRYRASFMDDPLFVNLQYAVNERQEAKFDLARRRYDKMIRENPEGASLEEVYWGRFLCEQYVIFYQNDLDEAIPSFWEINREHYSRSQSYQKAMEYGEASGNAENYERLAELIEVYKTKYAKVKKEFPNGSQIFICFKDSGTTDRNLGYEIYNRFSRDYEVFFSPQSLNTITGNDYEPYIYHALKTAKVLLVLCSSRDALESKWVHNEWWRFYNFSRGTDKTIIPIFRNEFEPSMLPQELKNCQGHAENVHLIATLGERFAAIFKKSEAEEQSPAPAPKTVERKPQETKKAPVKSAPAKSAKTENATPTEKKKGAKGAILTALLLLVIGTAVCIGIFNQNKGGVTPPAGDPSYGGDESTDSSALDGGGVTPAEYFTFEENADGTYTVTYFDYESFTGTEVIIPATTAYCFSTGSESSPTSSEIGCVSRSERCLSYSSSILPEKYIPAASFSIISFSLTPSSGISGYATEGALNSDAPVIMENISSCPARLFLLFSTAPSIIISYTASRRER